LCDLLNSQVLAGGLK